MGKIGIYFNAIPFNSMRWKKKKSRNFLKSHSVLARFIPFKVKMDEILRTVQGYVVGNE
jgi:hypothetical protein